MLDSLDVFIVSAFGRGHWLAQELAQKGRRVALADVSSLMGRWSPEDWEGPFGYFRSDRLSSSQLERLVGDEASEVAERGFTLWLKQGPIEMKGPVAEHALSSWKFSKECLDYLRHYRTLKESEREQLRRRLSDQSFAENWLAQLAHHLTEAVPSDAVSALTTSEKGPLPLFSSYYLRRPSWRGFSRSLDECERQGVVVLGPSEILDFALSRKKVHGIEVRSEVHSGVLFAENMVWMLSSEESQRLNPLVHERLFPTGATQADWMWMRFRLTLPGDVSLGEIPPFFVTLEDHHLDWSHDNYCIHLRTMKASDLDVWAKLPVAQRFHRAYVKDLGQKICQNLSQRLGGAEVQCSQWPQDFIYDYEEIGAPRFPLFSAEKRAKIQRMNVANLFYDGPELWRGLDWESQFRYQESVLQRLLRRTNAGQTKTGGHRSMQAEV